jgi:hypothetical protein
MRVISQDGIIDMPYEHICISTSYQNPKEIFAWHILGSDDDDVCIARYSTEEKAIKAMEMLREEYKKIREYETDYMGFALDHPKVFQFPQDDEIDV